MVRVRVRVRVRVKVRVRVRVGIRVRVKVRAGHAHEGVGQRVQEEPATGRDVPPAEIWGDVGRCGQIWADMSM